jgi:hypothetical protein
LNRKLILLNLVLIALAVTLVWVLRARRMEVRAHERAVLAQAARVRPVLPPAPPPALKPVMPAEYIEVAQKTLFSKDRNPNVIVEVPPPKPDPPLPPLPQYHGQMAMFGDPVVFLSTDAAGNQKSYRVGDKVGPFKIVSFDREKITLAWESKTVERRLSELAPKEAPREILVAAPSAPAAPRPAATSLSPAVKAIGAAESTLGADMGGGFHGCVTGDTSPNGTIKDGFKKVMTQTPFGASCHWEQVK